MHYALFSLLPLPQIHNAKSCPKRLSATFQDNVKKEYNQYLSPNWRPLMGGARQKCDPQDHSPMSSEILQFNRVARRLFSPIKPSKSHCEVNFFTPKSNTNRHEKGLLFDTPQRQLLSLPQLNEKIKRCILGKGSFGVVVKGEYKNENVAVKIIVSKNNEKKFKIMESEMNAIGLKHPNIVTVNKVIKHSSNIGFVLMELCDHPTLEQLLQYKILNVYTKLKFLIQIASALQYCHDKNILHLDLKPKNILVSLSKNTCKICDFGSSANITTEALSRNPFLGTLKYSAPELLRGNIPTEKADVYSFGITMWQMIHQKLPYDEEDIHIVVYRVVAQNYRPHCHLNKLSGENQYSKIYKACWATKPNERPAMSKVWEMLNELNSNFTEINL